jgi:hypothetical protein
VKDQETEQSVLCSNMGVSSRVRGQEDERKKRREQYGVCIEIVDIEGNFVFKRFLPFISFQTIHNNMRLHIRTADFVDSYTRTLSNCD